MSCTYVHTHWASFHELLVTVGPHSTLHSNNDRFLLLARYFLTYRKRSILDQCKKKYIDDRPTTDQRPHIWENFKWPYLREGPSDPLHVWFYSGVLEVGRSNGANSGLTKFNRYVGENNARGVIRLVTI